MAFNLGNFAVKEIIYGVGQDFETDDILYVVDQLSSASIEVSSDPVEVTDKRGNVIRTMYNSKSASFSATNALLCPVALNIQSGSDMVYASEGAGAIKMPEILPVEYKAENGVNQSELKILGFDGTTTTFKVIELYSNGANGANLTQGTDFTVAKVGDNTVLSFAKTYDSDAEKPSQYIVAFDRKRTSGLVLKNSADAFPKTHHLKLYAAIMDPCKGSYRAAIIYIPSFTPDPSVTLNFSSDSTETDFNGKIEVSYCKADKMLYYIYFLDEDAVFSGVVA